MKMSKKLWALISLSLLILTACGSAVKEEKIDDTVAKTEAKTDVEIVKVEPFISEDGSFSINFPGTPKVIMNDAGAEGDLGLGGATYGYDLSNKESFAVSYTDGDPATMAKVSKEDIRALLKEGQSGFLEDFGALVTEDEKEMDYDEYPGLRYKTTVLKEYAVVQNYVVGSRFYQILMLKIGDYPTEKAVNDFIGSFKLLK